MTNISTGDVSPGDNRDRDRKNLPMTQVDEEEVAQHRTGGDQAPEGEGVGIGGEPTRLPDDEERGEAS